MRQQAIVSSADPSARRRAGDPYGLSPSRDEEPSHRNRRPAPRNVLEKVSRQVPVNLDPVTGRWNAPFFMASYNTRIVRRSNALTNWSYGRDFRYDEVMDTGRGPGGAVKAGLTTAVLGGVFTGMSFVPSNGSIANWMDPFESGVPIDRTSPATSPTSTRVATGRTAASASRSA